MREEHPATHLRVALKAPTGTTRRARKATAKPDTPRSMAEEYAERRKALSEATKRRQGALRNSASRKAKLARTKPQP